MKKFFLLLLISLLFLNQSNAQNNNFKMRALPGVAFGYAFGKGVYGHLDLGLSFIDYKVNGMPAYFGINTSYAICTNKMELYEKGFFRTLSFNFQNIINQQIFTKVGIARTKLKWGLNNINTAKNGWAPNFEIGLAPIKNYPYLGYRFFKNNTRCLGMYQRNGKFAFVGYTLPVMLIDKKKTSATNNQ